MAPEEISEPELVPVVAEQAEQVPQPA